MKKLVWKKKFKSSQLSKISRNLKISVLKTNYCIHTWVLLVNYSGLQLSKKYENWGELSSFNCWFFKKIGLIFQISLSRFEGSFLLKLVLVFQLEYLRIKPYIRIFFSSFYCEGNLWKIGEHGLHAFFIKQFFKNTRLKFCQEKVKQAIGITRGSAFFNKNKN